MVTKGMRVGKYELGRTLGEGNSAKVKLATDIISGQSFAVKIIDTPSIKRLNVSFQIKREIRTLKVLRHPNIVRLHEIFKGDPPIPRWLSPGAKTMIKKMLDPNPITRMTIAGIKANDWFNHDYTPSNSDDEYVASSIQEDVSEEEKRPYSPTIINAIELIGMSSFLDLSGLFETEKVLHRQIRFITDRLAIDVLEKIKTTLTEMGFYVQKKHTMLKAIEQKSNRKGQSGLSLTAEIRSFRC